MKQIKNLKPKLYGNIIDKQLHLENIYWQLKFALSLEINHVKNENIGYL